MQSDANNPEPVTQPSSSSQEQSSEKSSHPWWRAALPHLLTAILTVLLSLGIQSQLPTRSTLPPIATSTPLPQLPTSVATVPTLATTPAEQLPTALPPASDITRQELIDLHTEDERIWSAIYLARAISQIADAETAMRTNDLDRVDQLIIAADASMAKALTRTATALRDPIAQLRRDAALIREDLYLRPEGMDERLTRLRQTLLVLIDAEQ